MSLPGKYPPSLSLNKHYGWWRRASSKNLRRKKWKQVAALEKPGRFPPRAILAFFKKLPKEKHCLVLIMRLILPQPLCEPSGKSERVASLEKWSWEWTKRPSCMMRRIYIWMEAATFSFRTTTGHQRYITGQILWYMIDQTWLRWPQYWRLQSGSGSIFWLFTRQKASQLVFTGNRVLYKLLIDTKINIFFVSFFVGGKF